MTGFVTKHDDGFWVAGGDAIHAVLADYAAAWVFPERLSFESVCDVRTDRLTASGSLACRDPFGRAHLLPFKASGCDSQAPFTVFDALGWRVFGYTQTVLNGVALREALQRAERHVLTWICPESGLEWMRAALPGEFSWDAARRAVTDGNAAGGWAGFSDWRLPAPSEVQALLGVAGGRLSGLPKGAFPDLEDEIATQGIAGNLFAWSFCRVTGTHDRAYGVTFNTGRTLDAPKPMFGKALIVRSVEI